MTIRMHMKKRSQEHKYRAEKSGNRLQTEVVNTERIDAVTEISEK